MSDKHLAKNICEAIKEILDKLPLDKWEAHHHKAAKLMNYERKQEAK